MISLRAEENQCCFSSDVSLCICLWSPEKAARSQFRLIFIISEQKQCGTKLLNESWNKCWFYCVAVCTGREKIFLQNVIIDKRKSFNCCYYGAGNKIQKGLCCPQSTQWTSIGGVLTWFPKTLLHQTMGPPWRRKMPPHRLFTCLHRDMLCCVWCVTT